ncbi:amidohydrolase [Rossellomorea aquimaris]|uniref:amidohydrolase n=1 Tax=Rossellomorea aquimaris TaxID=189382 RepID=UPI001CD5797E|nr:amidohydrolase [Rossellomorea aquimaris]MCA1055977.1 amidohydrolase [Rossellomorea aquimaris]
MDINKQIVEWFRYFHAHPEVSWKEYGTTNKIAEILDELGVGYRRFPDVTGLIAEIGEGEVVTAVRADIDALWQEVDDVMQANHSCGHDANISMVLGALLHLLEDPPKDKKIRFIFQPAEEKGNGSLAMIEKGALDGVGFLFGVHLRPKEELRDGYFAPSIHHGAGIYMEGKIKGMDAHGARPHQGKNSIDVLMAIHSYIRSIYLSPFESYSAKLTKLIAGGENLNIIPGNAEFAIDVRAQKNEVLEEIQKRLGEGIEGIEKVYGVKIDYAWTDHTPGAVVSAEAEDIIRKAIGSIAGERVLAQPVITSGSDDFHFYTIKHPEVKAAMMGVGADLSPGLHHPRMTFNISALSQAAKILAETLRRA